MQPPQHPQQIATSVGTIGSSFLVKIGYSAEPVVSLSHRVRPTLYNEALARLMMPASTMVRGGSFIPQLEAQGAIGMLDQAILEMAIDVLRQDPKAVLGCNISPFSLGDPLVWRRIMKSIEDCGELAGRLVLEITETAPLDQITDCAVRLRAAKNLGCLLAIDDFGAAYATAATLKPLRFEWDIIKLDRTCLGDPRKRAYNSAGFRTLARIARDFAPIVVAEGIESEMHFSVALAADVKWGQGWFFGSNSKLENWCRPSRLLREHLLRALK